MVRELDDLLAQAVSQAKMLGLRSVVSHALFVVTHQALGDEANRVLRELGVNPEAYCRKVLEDIKAMPRVKGGDVFRYRPGDACYCCLVGNHAFDAAAAAMASPAWTA